MELLCHRTSFNERHLELETDVGLKSRMRENRTYGSVRGIRQAFHFYILERSVEIAYSTDHNDLQTYVR